MKIVLIRHGECDGLTEGIYNGWLDLELTEVGKQQAVEAGQILTDQNIHIDKVFTSELSRTKKTAEAVISKLKENNLIGDERYKSTYLLNERHFGDFQGKTAKELENNEKYSEVFSKRRNFDTVLPPISNLEYNKLVEEYSKILNISDRSKLLKIIPRSETVMDCENRLNEFYDKYLFNYLDQNYESNIDLGVVIVSHAYPLKLIAKKIENIEYDKAFTYLFATCGMYIYDVDYDRENREFKVNSKTILNNNYYA